MKHQNNGDCPMCKAIIDRYVGFDANLRGWFTDLQSRYPEMHTSCAGRGRLDQESCFAKGASRAHWGQSSHNYNLAMDIFVISDKYPGQLYPKEWFNHTLGPNLRPWIEWYGAQGSKFFELPHVEIRGWMQLVKAGAVHLVSDVSGNSP